MFDLVFDSMMAFQSIMMLGGGLICLVIGALLMGDFIYWRMKAARLKGRIVSFTERAGSDGDMFYYPVVEYTDRRGQTQRITADVGHGALDDRKIGSLVTILSLSGRDDVRILGMGWIMVFVGTIFVGVAAVLMYHGARMIEWNLTAFGVCALVILYIAVKLMKHVKTKEKWQSLKEVKGMRLKQADKQRMGKGRELSPQQIKEKSRSQRKQQAVVSWLVLLIGLIFSGFGYYMGQSIWQLEQNGMSAPGKVVEVKSSTDSDGTTYFPVVRYEASDGRQIKFKSNYGSNPPSYKVGDDVRVLYDPSDPYENAMIDAGFWNWLLPSIFGGLGLVLCFVIFPSMRAQGNKAL